MCICIRWATDNHPWIWFSTFLHPLECGGNCRFPPPPGHSAGFTWGDYHGQLPYSEKLDVDDVGGPSVRKVHFSDVEEDWFGFVALDLVVRGLAEKIADQEPHGVTWCAGAAWQLVSYSKSRALTLGSCTHSA